MHDFDPEPAEPPTELGELSPEPVKDTTSQGEQDPFTVKWDGPDDPGDPLNTPAWRKWYVHVQSALNACFSRRRPGSC